MFQYFNSSSQFVSSQNLDTQVFQREQGLRFHSDSQFANSQKIGNRIETDFEKVSILQFQFAVRQFTDFRYSSISDRTGTKIWFWFAIRQFTEDRKQNWKRFWKCFKTSIPVRSSPVHRIQILKYFREKRVY